MSGTGVEAKSQAATMQFVFVVLSARLPKRPLLPLPYVFEGELRSSLKKLTP